MTTATLMSSARSVPAGLGFIPEIQGLRTIALVLVATFHVWFGRVSGGVDVFLLISAYLMTRSLTAASESGDQPMPIRTIILKFARLLPLAAAVIVATVLVAWMVLPVREFAGVNADALSALTYTSNFRFQDLQVDYYAADHGHASLFQHFWSLSIQGQVFVLWPLIHLLCHAWARAARVPVRKILIGVFGALFIASFTWSVVFTATDQTIAYFDTFARLWEFAAGSLLALVSPWVRLGARSRTVLSAAGIAGVVTCGFVLPVQSSFPGYAALWPVVASALVILSAGGSAPGAPQRLLRSEVLAHAARYTYALYLVHWPVLVLFLILTGRDRAGILGGSAVLAVSAALSILLTRLVEQPTATWASMRRAGAHPLRRPVAVIAVAVVVAAGIVGLGEGVRARDASQAQLRVESADLLELGANWPDAPMFDNPLPGDEIVATDYLVEGVFCPEDDPYLLGPGSDEVCLQRFSDADENAPLVFAAGNSHSQQLSAVAFEAADRIGIPSVRTHAAPGCEFSWSPEPTGDEDTCTRFWEIATDYILAERPSVVLMMATRSTDTGDDVLFEHLPDWVGMLSQDVPETTVVTVRDNPRFDFVPYECAVSNGWDSRDCDVAVSPVDLSEYTLSLHEAGAVWVDLTSSICPGGVCQPQLGGVVTYFDTNHLTATFVRTLSESFTEVVSPYVDWWPSSLR